MGMKSNGGEIVQVQGGHIVRPTGRKDRHSKVYTAKGPRDRRVRLSAHTAIQFYDLQDRLGYDRPSKAVDWLIKKAKNAIDKLAELPPWHPIANDSNANLETDQDHGSNEIDVPGQLETPGYGFQLQRQFNDNPNSSFIAGHMNPEVVPDTMKPFFPTSSGNFQSYSADIISRAANHTEDLGLSLVHGHSQANAGHTPANQHPEVYSGLDPVGFENNLQRNVAWGNDSTTFPQQHQPIGHGMDFSKRGTLQSSFAQYVRTWSDLPMASMARQRTQELHQSIFGSRFASEGFPGFNVPAGIQGEEEQSGVSDRPSTSSPKSQ